MNSTQNTGSGYLSVIVQTADGALPVPGASVTIYGTDAENGNTNLLYSLRTGGDGRTETVSLPAPPRALSMVPGNAAPYARYNIEVRRDGYAGVSNIGVPIFDGIVSTQPVALIPLGEFEAPGTTERFFETPSGESALL